MHHIENDIDRERFMDDMREKLADLPRHRSRHENNRNPSCLWVAAYPVRQVESRALWHHQISHDERHRVLLDESERGGSVAGCKHPKTIVFEHGAQQIQYFVLIIND